MRTIKLHASAHWTDKTTVEGQSTLWNRFTAFADGQSKHRTVWFLVSLMTQGVLFLPIPAALMYYCNAPIIVLAITMFLFFASVISGMGGSSIRTMISLFALSTLIHLLMIAVFVI